MYGQPSNFAELVGVFIDILSLVIPFLFGLSLLVIIWKVIDAWIINGGDVKKIEEGRNVAVWGTRPLEDAGPACPQPESLRRRPCSPGRAGAARDGGARDRPWPSPKPI